VPSLFVLEFFAYAVGCATVFGSASMLLYPVLAGILHLIPHAFGLWAGAWVHEIAQVVATAFENDVDGGHFGTIAKLSRVMLLAPMILAFGYFSANNRRTGSGESSKQQSIPIPWFVLGFVVAMLLNSFGLIPQVEKAYLVQTTTFLLSVGAAAMGRQTDMLKLRAKGCKPLLVGAGSWLFISAFSVVLVELAYSQESRKPSRQ
jgi:uncharacterized integral membrane protein (TIGR00698 family)